MSILKGMALVAGVLGLFLFGAAGCGEDPVNDSHGTSQGSNASAYSADTMVRWNNELRAAIKRESTAPMVAARMIGYCGVAAYEAAIPGLPDHMSMGGQLNELGALPSPAAGEVHWPASVSAAYLAVANYLFTGKQTSLDAFAALNATLNSEYDDTVTAATLTRSATFGTAVGAAVVQWAQADRFSTLSGMTYTVPTGPGLWVPTPPAFAASPAQPYWGTLRPMVLAYGGEVAPPPPPPFSETAGSQFHNEAIEVQQVGLNLSAEQMAIADFWNDAAGAAGTPPAHWVSIINQVATTNAWKLDKLLEATARTGIAVNDAFICCWDAKYVYNQVRPVSYIQSTTGLNDPTWLPYITTPAFPDYISGHSTQSGAATFVLTDMLGVVAFTDDTHADRALPARSFASINAAGEEAADSRLYGGIHYRSSNVRGLNCGRGVGAKIIERVTWMK